MALTTNFKIKPVVKTVLIKELEKLAGEWMAWWYCGIYKNHIANSQPKVYVAFREVREGNLGEKIIRINIPLTDLGQVTVGSIWKNGKCRSEIDLVSKDFDVDFRIDGWRFTSFEDAFNNGTESPYPIDIHNPQYVKDKNWLIEFKLQSGGKLIVPCLELFSRCYGRSQEIKRILATYTWRDSEDSCQEKLYLPIDEREEEQIKWKIKLPNRLRNGDTTFVAHVKYDPYSEAKAKLINAQIEHMHDSKSKSPIFIQVAPWFQGPAEIRVSGMWFDNNRSFLALRINGCSDPDGILISREREYANKIGGDNSEETDGEAWNGPVDKKLIRPPEIVDLTGDAEPDHGSSGVELLDDDFVTLGIPRAIVDRYGKKVRDGKHSKKRKGDDVSVYSSGEPYGSGKGVGRASIHAKPIMESRGTLMDMWKAMLYIKRQHPTKIQSVEWFTFEDGYNSIDLPKLIALDPIDEDDELDIPTETRSWIYHNSAIGRLRGVMVVRLRIRGIPIHIIELQRKIVNVKDKHGNIIKVDESFKGFILIIKDNEEFMRWLKRFLSDVRYIRGIVDKLTPFVPGKVDTFSHRLKGNENVPCEATVIKALSKIGVVL